MIDDYDDIIRNMHWSSKFAGPVLQYLAHTFPQQVFPFNVIYNGDWMVNYDDEQSVFSWRVFWTDYIVPAPFDGLVAVQITFVSDGRTDRGDNHALIFNKQTTTIEHFYSNDIDDDDRVKKIADLFGWQYMPPISTSPNFNGEFVAIQTLLPRNSHFADSCRLWSLWFIMKRLSHPTRPSYDIPQALVDSLAINMISVIHGVGSLLANSLYDIALFFARAAFGRRHDFYHTFENLDQTDIDIVCDCATRTCLPNRDLSITEQQRDKLIKIPADGREGVFTRMVPARMLYDDAPADADEVAVTCLANAGQPYASCRQRVFVDEGATLADRDLLFAPTRNMPAKVQKWCQDFEEGNTSDDEDIGRYVSDTPLSAYNPEGWAKRSPVKALCTCADDPQHPGRSRLLGCRANMNTAVKTWPTCPSVDTAQHIEATDEYKHWL